MPRGGLGRGPSLDASGAATAGLWPVGPDPEVEAPDPGMEVPDPELEGVLAVVAAALRGGGWSFR